MALIQTIDLGEGNEINVYKDTDGYHAERWDEAQQLITEQSGDQDTAAEAVKAVDPRVREYCD